MQQDAAVVFFFGGIWIILALPNYKMTYTMIFSPFDAIFNEKPNMLHFWLVCSNYAAICCQQWFFWVFWIVITFLGSGHDRGRSPVEWGDFPSVRPSVHPSVRTSPSRAQEPARQALDPASQASEPAR